MKILKLLTLSLVFACRANGVVLVTDIPDRWIFTVNTIFVDIDIDNNGRDDVRLEAGFGDISLITLSDDVRVATVLTGGSNVGGNNVPFNAGESIGSELILAASWFQASGGLNGRSGLIACRDIGCIGLWGFGVNYAGVQITDEEGNERYGWIELDIPSRNDIAHLTQFAFETDANTAIIAGVPEPSVSLFCLIGLMMITRRTRRK